MPYKPATRREPFGLGLGLYICREIVLAHGGTLQVASSAEEGTTFLVKPAYGQDQATCSRSAAILAKSHGGPPMEQHYRIFKATLTNMRRTMRQLEKAVPPPVVIEVEPGHPHVRYVERLPSQAIVMKLARLASTAGEVMRR